MNGYEKLIKTIREESTKEIVKYPIKIGVMQSPTKCKVGALELDAGDLVFPIELVSFDSVLNKYESQLSRGHRVLITQISDSKFAILQRIVEVD